MHKLILDNLLLTDQYNGFVTLKDFELPDDGFDWGAETCWSDWSAINYPELICAFRWFIFVFIIENARSKKQNTKRLWETPRPKFKMYRSHFRG